jgi:ABC transporter substrate binding protein (PQQ-dependent alcohol dehydrogenase system)
MKWSGLPAAALKSAARLSAALLSAALAGPAAAATFKVTLLMPADDPRLERSRLERAALGHPGGPAVEALQVALKEGAVELDAAGAKIELDAVEVADAAAARAAAQKAEKAGAAAIVTDLPAAWTLAVADAAPKLTVLNTGEAADSLREADCRANLLHLIPSLRMGADALAQTLVARRWTNVLLLTGPLPADGPRSTTVQAALKRYGLKVVSSKPFKLSADPRERDLGNPLLLTGAASTGNYDVVWVVDSDGEFATGLPYRTGLPRPVVGDGGLVAVAWSHRFERFGAPQVSRRLVKAARRNMTSHDWAAWMAGKALVAAGVAAPKGPAAAFSKALAAAELDGSKGVVMSFRAWDGQLRQPVLLSDGQSVVTSAPGEGVLHPKNNLDTLGADAPEKLCKART